MDVDEHIKELLTQVQQNYSESRTHQIGFAALYAAKAHSTQQRKSGEAYMHHLLRVAQKLLSLDDPRVDDVTIIAALLHDIVEDTNKTLDTVHMQFGRDVAAIVDALSKKAQTGTKQEQDKEYFAQVQQATKQDPRVGLIKLCDQIDNGQSLDVHKPQRMKQKVQHLQEVWLPLAEQLANEQLITELQETIDKYQV